MGRILVVDDDPDILKLSERVLASAGHIVVTVEDVLRALDLMNYVEFDMVISDANMPHYSGFDLVQTLRKNPKFKDLSIAMLTGLRERKHIDRAVQAGVDDYIVKPIDPMILIEKVTALFNKKPPIDYPEILVSPEMGKVAMKITLTLESVSELGCKMVSDVPIRPGQVLDVEADFFKVLDAAPPPMKVLSADLNKSTGQWHLNLIFLGAREAFLQKVRRWMHTHGGSNKSAA